MTNLYSSSAVVSLPRKTPQAFLALLLVLASASLIAATVPGPPTGVTGVGGNGQVTVSFTAPSSDGGSPITSYTVTASPGGATGTGTASPIVVTGLTNGTAYTFTVVATNAVGTGPPWNIASFAARIDFAAEFMPLVVAIADLNGDGKPDLVAANFSANTVSVLLNSTAAGSTVPTFVPKTDFATGTGPQSVAIGDLNGDGKADLAVANSGANTVSVLLNATATGATTPTFAGKTDFPTGSGPRSVAIGDLNGDGEPDLAVANLNSNTTSVLLNTTPTGATTPAFAAKADFAIGNHPLAEAIGDLNGDGKLDLVTANTDATNVSVLLNTTAAGATAPAFAARTDFPTGANPWSVAIGDLNGDGKPDLATANTNASTASVLLNTTATGASMPAFAAKTEFITATAPSSMAIGDLNGDGKPDLVAATFHGSRLSVLLNTTAAGATTPAFADKTDFATGSMSTSVAIGDLNGDGKPDLSFTANNVSVLVNTTVSGGSAPVTPATVPDAPTNVSGVGGNGQVTVVFTAPANAGGLPITSYRVTALPGGATATGAGSPLVVFGLTNGTSYTFTVTATNGVGTGPASSPSAAVTSLPAVSPSLLWYAAAKAGAGGGLSSVTPAQSVTVPFPGSAAAWTVSVNQPWVQLSTTGGTGAGTFTASIINPNNVIGAGTILTATITVTPAGTANAPQTVAVMLAIDQLNGLGAAPFGQVDTPVQNAAGVQGAIGVTGWVLDNIGVADVKIYRNCLAFENQASCQVIQGQNVVLVGSAVFLAGARPDVERLFPTVTQAYRAGWGFMVLTNILPHVTNSQPFGGQGPLTLYVFATDVEGNVTLLGRDLTSHAPTAIAMANDTIAKPFGAIDTPGQGETVSGVLNNFGWVLTPDSNTTADGTDILMPFDGLTLKVFIDSLPAGTVTYDLCRGTVGNPVPATVFCDDDVANIFGHPTPQPIGLRTANVTKHRNLDVGRGAIGLFTIDTTTLTNGRHSIAWGVTDSAGRVEGIGSRNFNVLNNVSDVALATAADEAGIQTRGHVSSLAGLRPATAVVSARQGFDPETAFTALEPIAAGTYAVPVTDLGRVELRLHNSSREESEAAPAARATTKGYLIAGEVLRDLPAGSSLDAASGTFTWAPVPGFLGTYPLVFLRDGETIRVDVTVGSSSSPTPGTRAARMHIELPTAATTESGVVTIAGWALDPDATIGSGIDAVQVWATATGPNAAPVFLGRATLEDARSDVAAAFGEQFDRAGFSLTTLALRPGVYDLVVYVHSVRTGRWEDARAVRVTVK